MWTRLWWVYHITDSSDNLQLKTKDASEYLEVWVVVGLKSRIKFFYHLQESLLWLFIKDCYDLKTWVPASRIFGSSVSWVSEHRTVSFPLKSHRFAFFLSFLLTNLSKIVKIQIKHKKLFVKMDSDVSMLCSPKVLTELILRKINLSNAFNRLEILQNIDCTHIRWSSRIINI